MKKYILSAFADEAAPALSGQIEALKANGISLIELRNVNGKSVAKLTDDEARQTWRQLSDAGIGLSALGSPYGKFPIDEDFAPHLADFRRGLELCQLLHTDKMRMFSFFMPKDSDPESWRNAVLDRLETMQGYAQEAGVLLAHENEKGIYGDNLERCQTLKAHFGDRLGCIFDPANFIQCGVATVPAMEALAGDVLYMHIKDAMMENGAVVPAGKGDGQVGRLLEMLPDREEPYILTLEPHLHVFDALKELQSETLRFKYVFNTPREAFDAASAALHDILANQKV